MSATTFLLILAAVVAVFAGYLVKSWFELSRFSRGKKRKKERDR
ncbi:MAG: hypothetical protein WAL83_16120 [Arenicellales bacterium]|jgi:hypothetical protein